MKISEKTLELNICAQMHSVVAPKQRLLWFGLTQRQEARWGFDACTKLGGRLLVFQFKASNHVLRNGARKFQLDHVQLTKLQGLAGSYMRSVFYAFPLVGNTRELAKSKSLLHDTWLLDLAPLPAIPTPTKKDKTPRRNGRHNAQIRPGKITIYSDPVNAELVSMAEFASEGFPGTDGLMGDVNEALPGFWDMRQHLTRGARGLIVY